MNTMGIVTVLAGGDSTERDVSLVSGQCVYEAFRQLELPVKLLVVDDVDDLLQHLHELEVVFSVLHGGAGESGIVQRILEAHSLSYAGSGPEASALGMDKLLTKQVLASAGLAVRRALKYAGEDLQAFAAEVERRFSPPFVVKPRSHGASLGVVRVDTAGDLVPTFRSELSAFGAFFVEEFIRGRELTVSVLRLDGEDRALPVVEIVIATDFFDFRTKYTDGLCKTIVPAPLNETARQRVEQAALTTHRALGCWGFSRVDILLSGDDTPYVLETNTLPGMTPHSMLPKTAAEYGIEYPQLVERMLMSAFTRPKATGSELVRPQPAEC